MKNDIKKYKYGVAVLQLPRFIEQVQVSKTNDGWVIKFQTKAGLFYLRKVLHEEPLYIKSLDFVLKRVRKLGWNKSVVILGR